jgi:protein-tyrosine phosphatase
MRLLFVCTGNLCRSPIAQGLAQAWVARHAAADAWQVDIVSAGTSAVVDQPMDRHSAQALARRGGDGAQIRARALTAELAAGADLVLTMTRRHRRAVLALSPKGLRRTFTLLEAADLVRDVDMRDLVTAPLDDRIRELGLRLDARRALRVATDADDVLDPIGRRAPVHEQVADSIAGTLHPLLSALFPAAARLRPERRTDGLPVGA